MSSRASAKRYARALFDVTDSSSRVQVDEELTATAALLANQGEFQAVIASPSVSPALKRGIVQAVLAKGAAGQPVSKLLTMLAERDRLAILTDVAAAFHEHVLEDQQILLADVTTAAPLADDERLALQARLSAATSKQVRITSHVDPSIIGGIVTRIGSTVYDGSLANQLARIRERLSVAR